MNLASNTPQKKEKGVLFRILESPVVNSPTNQSNSPPTSRTTTTSYFGICCCRSGLNDCINMGGNVSKNNYDHDHSVSRISNLEKEVQKQKELMAVYRMRLERTQNYLRHCLQIAKDNGFLDLLIGNNAIDENEQQRPLTPNILNIKNSPRDRPPSYHAQHADLAAIIDQAKLNGWYIEPDEIDFHEQVGQGSTADIYKATWRGLTVAVKCINPESFTTSANGITFFAQELETLSRQRHCFVLQLMGACIEPPNHCWVITEFLNMSLKDWLHGKGGNRRQKRTIILPPFDQRVAKALEISQAMQYLHAQNPKLIHRDLKPSNIFLDDAMHIRVADFGHARFLSDNEKALTGEIGTYVYMAPEIFRGMPYDDKCDIFSFGVILNELITGEFPYIETNYGPSKIAMEVAEGRLRPALPKDEEGHHEELVELICRCWDENPISRPSFPSITCTLKRILQRDFM